MNDQRFRLYRAIVFLFLPIGASCVWGQLDYENQPQSPYEYSDYDWGWQEDITLRMPWDEDEPWTGLGMSLYDDFPTLEQEAPETVAPRPAAAARPPRVDGFTRRVQEALANVGSFRTRAQSNALKKYLPVSRQGRNAPALKSTGMLTSSWLTPDDLFAPPKPNPFSVDLQEILTTRWSERSVSTDNAAPSAETTKILFPEGAPRLESDLTSRRIQQGDPSESAAKTEDEEMAPPATAATRDGKTGKLDRLRERSAKAAEEETARRGSQGEEMRRGLAQKTAIERLQRGQTNRSRLSSQRLRSRGTGSSLAPGQDDETTPAGILGSRTTGKIRKAPQYYRNTTGDVRQPDYSYRFTGPRRYSIGEREYGNQPSYQGLPYYRRQN